MCRPRGHNNPAPRQHTFGQLIFNGGDNFGGFGHTTGSKFPTGHIPLIGANKSHTVVFQRRQIPLGGRVQPHAHIHRWRHKHLRIGGQQQGRGQIIRLPRSHLGHQVRRARRDHNQIRGSRELNMAHFRLIGEVKQILIGLFLCQGRDRQRCHKLLCGFGQHRCHPSPAFAQLADQVQGFISGDSTTDDQQNSFVFQHLASPSSR